jgi:hypothetical protein
LRNLHRARSNLINGAAAERNLAAAAETLAEESDNNNVRGGALSDSMQLSFN